MSARKNFRIVVAVSAVAAVLGLGFALTPATAAAEECQTPCWKDPVTGKIICGTPCP